MGYKGYLLIYEIQKEYNKIIDDNRGLQQNICCNIFYKGLVYWAKRIFLIQWWRERKRYSWQGYLLITGSYYKYLIKNDYRLRGGAGDIWSNKGYLLIKGADIWGTIEVGWHEASWPIMHSWPNVLCTLIMLVIMMTIMMRMRLAPVITANFAPNIPHVCPFCTQRIS